MVTVSACASRRLSVLLCASTALPMLFSTVAHAQQVAVASSGDIIVDEVSASGAPRAVSLTTDGGSIVATVDTVTATSTDTQYVDPAIYLGASEFIDADFGSITVSGTGNVAVLSAFNNVGDITLNVGSATADGNLTAGILGYSGEGNVAITVGSIELNGLGGPSDVVAPDTVGYNYYPDAIVANSFSGAATITAGSAISHGQFGSAAVVIGATSADLTIDYAEADSNGAVTLYAQAGTGAATVTAGTVIMNGDGSAIDAFSGGGGITVNADTVISGGRGIYADDGNGTIVVSYNSIISEESGIIALGKDVIVSDQGPNSSISAGNNGIYAEAGDSIAITVAGSIATDGDFGSGIRAVTQGTVDIAAADVLVSGPGAEPAVRPDGYRVDQGGIVVDGGAGAIAIDAGTVNVEGEYRYGITARGTGNISIAADTVNLASADSVAVVARGGDGDVSITTGTVTTTGASGVGIFGDTTTGNVLINAGTTRVESTGYQGWFTGDAVVGTSDSGDVTIVSDDAYSAALYGSAIVGIGGNVSIDANIAETTGDGGLAVYGRALAPGGTVTINADTIIASGSELIALSAVSSSGLASVTVGNVTANAGSDSAEGLQVRGLDTSITINGAVLAGGMAVNSQSLGGTSTVNVNGSVTSALGIGVLALGQNGELTVAEGASIEAARAAVVFTNYSPVDQGIMFLDNFGSITGSVGVYVNPNPQGLAPSVNIYNDGTITGTTSGFAVITGSGDDSLELTENAVINGVVDLGAGDSDILSVGFTDGATADAVGRVAQTINVEYLSVNDGTWIADTGHSVYDQIAIDAGSRLEIQQVDGSAAVVAPTVLLEGELALDFDTDSDPGDLTGILITGAGSLHLIGSATLLVDDASGLQHTGGTYVESGTFLLTDTLGSDVYTLGAGVFQLDDGTNSGDFTGNLVNDGTFVFARSDDYTFTGDFSGTGTLEKYGEGRLTFGGLYAFDGVSTIYEGSIALTGMLADNTQLSLSGGVFDLSQVTGGTQTIASLSGTGGTLILGDIALTINQTGTTSYAGDITGTGELIIDGTGDLKLEGDISFSGDALIESGTLSVNGSMTQADFFVSPAGTLGGNGTVGNVFVEGGTIAAGNSIGTLNVAGDLTLTSASVFEIEVNDAGGADLVNVSGTATLGGATAAILAEAGTYDPYTEYTVLTAGTVAGEFGAVTTNFAFLTPDFEYSATEVTLILRRNDVKFSAYGTTANQSAIGNLVEDLAVGSALYNQALLLTTGQAATAFETLTGEQYPAYLGGMIETAEMLGRQIRPAAGRGDGAFVWGNGLVGSVDGLAAGYRDAEISSTGVAAGFGYQQGGLTGSLGVGKVWHDADALGVSDADTMVLAGRVEWRQPSGLMVAAGIQKGWSDATVSRQASLGTINDSLTGDLDGDYTQFYGEIGYDLVSDSVSFGPFAGLSSVNVEGDDLTETGGVTALSISDLGRTVTFGRVGAHVDGRFEGGLTAGASLAWRRAWGDRMGTANVAFAGNTTPVAITALPIAKSAAEASAAIGYDLGGVTLEAGYDGTFSSTFDNHGGHVGVSFRF